MRLQVMLPHFDLLDFDSPNLVQKKELIWAGFSVLTGKRHSVERAKVAARGIVKRSDNGRT